MKRDELSTLRGRIDRLDRRLALLLLKRFQLVGRIGKIKREKGFPVMDGVREEEILKRIEALCPDTRASGLLKLMYADIFKVSYQIEEGR